MKLRIRQKFNDIRNIWKTFGPNRAIIVTKLYSSTKVSSLHFCFYSFIYRERNRASQFLAEGLQDIVAQAYPLWSPGIYMSLSIYLLVVKNVCPRDMEVLATTVWAHPKVKKINQWVKGMQAVMQGTCWVSWWRTQRWVVTLWECGSSPCLLPGK